LDKFGEFIMESVLEKIDNVTAENRSLKALLVYHMLKNDVYEIHLDKRSDLEYITAKAINLQSINVTESKHDISIQLIHKTPKTDGVKQ